MLSIRKTVTLALLFMLTFASLLLRPQAQGIHILSLFDVAETHGQPLLASHLLEDDKYEYYDESISNLTAYQDEKYDYYNEYISNMTAVKPLPLHENINETSGGHISTTPANASWTTAVAERFAARLLTLKAACRSYGNSLNYSVKRTLKRNLFYSKKYKLMVCAVAKAGSTTWKSHLLALGGITLIHNPQKVHGMHILRASEQLGKAGTLAALRSSATAAIMTARHPLDRLVSAYRDKFHDGAPMPSSNSFSQSALKELQRRGERGNVSFTFTEFLTHVLKEQSRDGLKNIHWRNYYRTCSPCALPYDFIMNTETFSEDLKYIVHKLGAKEIRVDWRFHVAPHNTTTTTSPHYMHYYTNITHALLKRVYHQYKIDFQMFGYEIPAVLKGALS